METSRKKLISRETVQRYGAVVMFFALYVFNAFYTKGFFTWRIFWNLIIQASPAILVAFGMTLVIATGNINISVGSMMGLGGVFRDKIKNPGTSLMCGSLVALGARYLSHILSGYLLFSGWADWFFTQDGFPAWGAKLVESLSPTALGWVYSIVYNGFYMIPELILTAIAAQLIARIPKIVVKVD